MKRLIKFCHEKNIYSKVYYYNKTFSPFNPKSFNAVLDGKYTFDTFFCNGFPWALTKEGYSFWYAIHREWQEYCRKNNIKYIKI